MKLTMVGTGYVGLVTGVCLSNTGNDVTCLDTDTRKIDMLRQGKCPIYEPGLVELILAYDGFNNGRIGLSVRRAAERCNIARRTAQFAFDALQERGFIECVTKGAFSRKTQHATEWRLTFKPCNVTGELPSKAFMRWGHKNQNAVSVYPDTVSIQHHHHRNKQPKCPNGASD